jgi:hypothetical protein
VLVTTGGQQVIDLVCRTLLDPGDVVVAEGPTYPGAVPSLSAFQADVRQVPMDEEGMRIDELEQTLAALDREGRRPKFIYTIPTFQNPSGATMSLERRQRLIEIAHEREIPHPRGQPVRPPALRGRGAADAALARRRPLRHLSRDLLQDPLPRAPARLDERPSPCPGQAQHRQAGR